MSTCLCLCTQLGIGTIGLGQRVLPLGVLDGSQSKRRGGSGTGCWGSEFLGWICSIARTGLGRSSHSTSSVVILNEISNS